MQLKDKIVKDKISVWSFKIRKKSLKFRIRANTAKTVSKTPLAVSGTKSDNVLIS